MSDPLATPARPAARARLSRRAAFWGLAATLGFLLFASSAPSPLYVVYQQQWGFSEITLTSVFAVYALALLGALLVAGSVSDHVGRRPTLLFALVLELAAMLVFAEAQGVVWLFGARILQGVGTGLAMGAISAALLDLQPEDNPRLGALVGVVAPLTGLAGGALTAGLLVEYGPDPTRLVYWLLVGTFAATVAVAAAMPETVSRDGRWLRSLRPRDHPVRRRDVGARRPSSLARAVADRRGARQHQPHRRRAADLRHGGDQRPRLHPPP